MNHNAYLTKRLIDTCLREDLFGLTSSASLQHSAPSGVNLSDEAASHPFWLSLQDSQVTVYVPVVSSHYMQKWTYAEKGWLEIRGDSAEPKDSYQQWISLLKHFASESSQPLLENYLDELMCAEAHAELCQQAYQQQKNKIAEPVSGLQRWDQKLLIADQIASYLDHPYYPTARAKFGFSEQDLKAYAPEFAATFKLNWLAIEKSQVTLTSPQPECWPSMEQVGLPLDFAESHILFPAHPMTFSTLNDLPAGAIKAPKAALDVIPTLSVRTVCVAEHPDIHIKVPLIMRTLGTKNIRLIKPSTIYDGHWFEQLLSHLAVNDQSLRGLYFHCNEKHGGHIEDDKTFAYIVRRYPQQHANDKALVPVAALASPMPDNRLFLEHLADQYYNADVLTWFTDYVHLLNYVHLSLWIRFGIALESNQQNAILAFAPDGKMSLAMKDNDAARIWPERFKHYAESAPVECDVLIDKRILVNDELALGQMYTTITLQLDIAAIVEAMSQAGIAPCYELYAIVRRSIEETLDALDAEGGHTHLARQLLLEDDFLYAKYLLSSGSLLSKQASGAADINKFYGKSAPNFLKLTSKEAFQEMTRDLVTL